MFDYQAIRKMTGLARHLTCGFTLCVAAGCYRYIPVQSEPEPGRTVRVELTDQAAAALTQQLGPGVVEIEGLLLNKEGRALSIAVDQYVTRRQGVLSGGNEPVRLPMEQLAGVQQKRIDPLRSAILGVGLSVAAFTVFKIVSSDDRALEDEIPEDPGNPRFLPRTAQPRAFWIGARIPVLRLP